jgi:hypothetical protein
MKITSSSSGMGYPGGRNSYANGQGPNGFFGAKLGTGFGAGHCACPKGQCRCGSLGNTGVENNILNPMHNASHSAYRSSANFLTSNTVKKFAKGGAIAGGVMGVATVAGVGMMGLEKYFKKQAGIKSRQGTGEVLLRGASAGLAVGAVYGLILTTMSGYRS